MKRSGPLRSDPMKVLAWRQRSATRWARSRARTGTDLAVYRDARSEVEARSFGRCEVSVDGVCTGRMDHAHHRVPRSQGGTDAAANLLAACSPCHAWVHNHPTLARAAGWLAAIEGEAP